MEKRIYKSMQGKEVDMDALLAKNETMPAIGNVRVNARGDELGPGGKIIKKREDIVAEYYEDNPNATPAHAAAPVVAPVVAPVEKPVTKTVAAKESKVNDE
jgi:hypothetical protein